MIIVLIFCRTTGSASDRLMALPAFAHLTPVGAEHFRELSEVFLRLGEYGPVQAVESACEFAGEFEVR